MAGCFAHWSGNMRAHAWAGEPDPKTYWDVKDLRPGMKGVGKTVMVGTKLEEFGAEVLGVMRDVSPGRDMVLCRLTGCNLEHAGIIQGMSGSPIYIDGKLAGRGGVRLGIRQGPDRRGDAVSADGSVRAGQRPADRGRGQGPRGGRELSRGAGLDRSRAGQPCRGRGLARLRVKCSALAGCRRRGGWHDQDRHSAGGDRLQPARLVVPGIAPAAPGHGAHGRRGGARACATRAGASASSSPALP